MSVKQTLSFDFNWKLTLFVVFLLPLLSSLGFWQLDRAEQKTALLKQLETQLAQPPKALVTDHTAANAGITDFSRVFAQGRFKPEKYWLRENQRFHHQLGYHVLMPFVLADNTIIVVNRGWVGGSPFREHIPEFDTPTKDITLIGVASVPSDSALIQEPDTPVLLWPHKILEADLDIMQNQFQQTLFNKTLRLDVDSPGALQVQWQAVNMSPSKHTAYAVQWFLMAVVLAILYIIASTNLVQVLRRKSP